MNGTSQPILGMMTATNGALEAPNDKVIATEKNGISADEIALYDRQIRLWGMKAQQKIRQANILLITLRGLGTEIAKNLVLAGVGSLTIVDDELVTAADFGTHFFLQEDEAHLGMNRALAAKPQIEKLNPRVTVSADPTSIRTRQPSFFTMFDLVIATDTDPGNLAIINTATRMAGRPFYAAGVHGFYGYIFADLIEHQYVLERPQSNVATLVKSESRTRLVEAVETKKEGGKTIEIISKRDLYSTWALASDLAPLPEEYLKSRRRLRAVTPTLSCLRALWQFQQMNGGRLPERSSAADLAEFTKDATIKHKELSLPTDTLRAEFLRSFLQNIGAEIAPVTAVLGGQLAQDVINVLGQTQQPMQNMVVFDGNTMEASMYSLHPDGPLGAAQLSTPEILADAVILDSAMQMAMPQPPLPMLPGMIPFGVAPPAAYDLNMAQLNGAGISTILPDTATTAASHMERNGFDS